MHTFLGMRSAGISSSASRSPSSRNWTLDSPYYQAVDTGREVPVRFYYSFRYIGCNYLPLFYVPITRRAECRIFSMTQDLRSRHPLRWLPLSFGGISSVAPMGCKKVKPQGEKPRETVILEFQSSKLLPIMRILPATPKPSRRLRSVPRLQAIWKSSFAMAMT